MKPSRERTHRSPRFSCWHPLLPTFSARLIIAFRTLLGISCVATFTLVPQTSKAIQGQLLLGVGFIVAMKTTLGSTIQSAVRLFLGGMIATCYCLFIINCFPRSIYVSVGATNVLVLVILYTDLPVTVRRFSIVPTCIILLQWYEKERINTLFVLQLWATLSTGASLAVLVTSIPLPAVPTAYRELTMRMRFIARQTRREITAIVLLISEYHNNHVNDTYGSEGHRHRKRESTPGDPDDGIEMPANSYREDDFYLHRSSSFEDLKDDHLLKSDIQDLHSLVNDELKQMQRALTEISHEPYFITLKFLNLLRSLCRRIPYIKKHVDSESTLQTRLTVWVAGLASIQRAITSMLILDHHHHAFVGQRHLINSICLLLDSSFNFLDATLPYTTASTSYFNINQVITCRSKVEEALENFFETYAEARENASHEHISNTDAIRLNTFLLLILRLVHATITTAEASKTPGVRFNTESETSSDVPKPKKPYNWKQPFNDLAAYIGIRPSFGKLARAVKTCLSVLISAVLVFAFRHHLKAMDWFYWAPMTTALVSDSSEGSTLRLSFQRLMAVLLGSTYAYLAVLITEDYLAVGICISLFVGVMGYVKTDPRKEYFASVCAQSASLITFLSNRTGKLSASKTAVLSRTSLTFIGIFVHVFVSSIFLPITARALTKKRVSIMMKNVSDSLKSATEDFCSFIGSSEGDQNASSPKKSSFNLNKTLGDTERFADGFPALLEEALNEPNLWKRPFVQVKDRYDDIAKALRRISGDIRFVHRCTTLLKAESKLHFAQEAKWKMRRTSLLYTNGAVDAKKARSWTVTQLRQEEQLQNDLDIPLTIFASYFPHTTIFEDKPLVSNNSSASLRLVHMTLYQPVLEHIRALESSIQTVMSLTAQVIEKETTVDVGSFQLQQLCREDSNDQNEVKRSRPRGVITRDPSFRAVPHFEALPMMKNHYRFFSCCQNAQEDHEPLPSLRNAVDSMLESLIQFLYANNSFMRSDVVANQSIGDVLAFHTLSYALKDMVEAVTTLAKNARRIKHIDTRTLVQTSREEHVSSKQQTV